MKDSFSAFDQHTDTTPFHLPHGASALPALTFNVLPFNHPEKTREFTFTASENTGKHRFIIGKLPREAAGLFPGLDPLHPFIYTNFDTSTEGELIRIDFDDQPAIAHAYYTLKIRDLLGATASMTVTNFLQDCQFWYVDTNVNNSLYDIYKKFTIRVRVDHRSRKPELLVTFNGHSYILKKSLAYLTENAAFDTSVLESVEFRKNIYQYSQIPNDALYHRNEIFPVISRRNMNALKVNLPTVINRKKYFSHHQELDSYFSSYLNTDEFRKIIPHEAKWKTALPADVHRLAHTGREMIFGQGHVSASVFDSLKTKGPHAIPGFKHSKIFIIYFENDLSAAQKLEEYIIKKDGFGSLSALARIPFEYDKGLDIILPADKNPVEVIRETLKIRSTDPECGYFAFYISPYTRFETQSVNHEIYFKIKEIMLRRGIGLQVIERNKIFGNFSYSIANIGIAMIAKMGGIPWRLSGNTDKELIIGFGAFKSQRYHTRYIGSSFCFSNDGVFREFNCFPADETWSIAGSAEAALMAYRKSNPDVKRLVIHFYQKIGRKQLKPIEDMLRRLKFDIPVIVVSINKTYSESQLAFDEAFHEKMPLNGSYVKIGRQEYLFCNNERENNDSNLKTLPMPIKIGLQSSHEGLLDDPELIERLMRQVYEFSFMHWRSVNQQNLPVTVTYPEMLARIFPWFDSDTLSDEGRRSLFFL
jgi:hypothetical protein